MKKFICRNCGVVNEANNATLTSSDDWLECTLATAFEWCLPAGKITPAVGEAIYISGNGEQLTQEAYIDKYKDEIPNNCGDILYPAVSHRCHDFEVM